MAASRLPKTWAQTHRHLLLARAVGGSAQVHGGGLCLWMGGHVMGSFFGVQWGAPSRALESGLCAQGPQDSRVTSGPSAPLPRSLTQGLPARGPGSQHLTGSAHTGPPTHALKGHTDVATN